MHEAQSAVTCPRGQLRERTGRLDMVHICTVQWAAITRSAATRNADVGEEDADDATSHDDLQGNPALSTAEFFRKLKRWAREHDVSWEVKKHESKGSHRRVYLGDRNTTVPWTKSLTTGVVHGVLKQLGIDDFF